MPAHLKYPSYGPTSTVSAEPAGCTTSMTSLGFSCSKKTSAMEVKRQVELACGATDEILLAWQREQRLLAWERLLPRLHRPSPATQSSQHQWLVLTSTSLREEINEHEAKAEARGKSVDD